MDDTLPLRAVEPASAPQPERPVQVALWGLGRSGLQHVVALSTLPNVEIVAVGDPDRAARRNVRGMGLLARAFARFELLLQRARPEAVFVAAPIGSDPQLIVHALDAGAAVLFEGDPVLPAAVLATLLGAATRRERPIACSCALAYHPVFDAARRLLAAGTVGATREVRAARYVSRVFSTTQQQALVEGGATRGVIARAAGDLMFVLVRMFGVPEAVAATAGRVYGTLDDDARGTWTVGSRTRLGFEVSWSTPGYPRPATVIEIEAEHGHMLVSEDALELDLAEPRGAFPVGRTRLGRADVPQLARFDLDGEARWLEDAAFLAWVTGGPESRTRLAAGLDAARVIDALYASLETGGRSVSVLTAEDAGTVAESHPAEVAR